MNGTTKGNVKRICSDLGLHLYPELSDREDLDSQGEGSSQPDTISLASRTSQNTLDSDKVVTHTFEDVCSSQLSMANDILFFFSSPVAVS